MAKISKHMRLKENLVELVDEKGKGNNFTEKLEYILNDYFYTEKERENRLQEIKMQIDLKQKKLISYEGKLNRMKKVLAATLNIIKYIEGQQSFYDVDSEIRTIKRCLNDND